MAGRTVNISEQVRITSKLRESDWMFEIQAVAEVKHVNPALVAETDEQGFGGPKDCSSKYSH